VLALFGLSALYVGGVAWFFNALTPPSDKPPDESSKATSSDSQWVLVAETEHFAYHVRPGDTIPRWAREMHESVLREVAGLLDVTVSSKIHYFKYSSQRDMSCSIGERTTGLTRRGDEGIEIHTVERYQPHEVTHAVIHQSWDPPAFFDEGLATAYGWDWDVPEANVHDHAYRLLREDRLLPLERILANWDFRRYKTYPAYSAAGSFVKYLLDTRDPKGLRSLVQMDKFSSRDQLDEAFLQAYGVPIDDVEREWRDALGDALLLRETPSPASSSSEAVETFLSAVALLVGLFLGTGVLIWAGERACAYLAVAFRGLAGSMWRR